MLPSQPSAPLHKTARVRKVPLCCSVLPPFHACSWHSGACSAWLTANDRFCFWGAPLFPLLLGICQAFVFCNMSDYSVPKKKQHPGFVLSKITSGSVMCFLHLSFCFHLCCCFPVQCRKSSPTSRPTNHPPMHQDELGEATDLYFRHQPEPLV